MSLVIPTESIPLTKDADGVIRIEGTRITLDTVVAAFLEGATAETIVEQYPSLSLADVYTVLGYFLNHKSEVEVYLQRRREQATQVRQENEARWNPIGIRARLLARRKI